jgi:hypothetical protein
MQSLREMLGFKNNTDGEDALLMSAPLVGAGIMFASENARKGVGSFLINGFSSIAGGDPLLLENNKQSAGYMMYNKGANPRQYTTLGQNIVNSGLQGDLIDDISKTGNSAAIKTKVNAHSSLQSQNHLGLMQGSKLTMALSLGLTGYFGYDSITQGGDNAIRDFVFSEFAANNAGLKRATNLVQGTNGTLATHNAFLGLKGNLQNGFTNSMFSGQMMLGRIAPILGGYTGAQLGIGFGEQLGKMVGNKYLGFKEDSTVTGFIGAAIGAGIGANVGALAGSGFLTMAGVGLAVMGAKEVANATTNILKTGFKERRKRRGLDFANNSEKMFTQYASTMRQRAFDAMSKSHLNARSALGNEAKLMYLDRDYYSSYRRI